MFGESRMILILGTLTGHMSERTARRLCQLNRQVFFKGYIIVSRNRGSQ